MKMLNDKDIIYQKNTGSDWNGYIFYLQGDENHVFRAITEYNANFYINMLNSGFIDELSQKGLLVPSSLSDIKLEKAAFVVQHKKIPFLSYPTEWNVYMWKDAAITLLDLQYELIKNDASIHDTHPWNILFDDYCKPVYVDLGGIMPMTDTSIYKSANLVNWPAYNQFANTFLNALTLFKWNHHRIARLMFLDYQTISQYEIESLVPKITSIKDFLKSKYYQIKGYASPYCLHDNVFSKILYFEHKSKHISSKETLKNFISELKDFITSLNIYPSRHDGIGYITAPNEDRTKYYYDMHGGYIPSPFPSDNWTAKNINVYKVLQYYAPKTLLDTCSSTGWYAMLAARHGARVVAFDIDEACITDLYWNAKKEHLNILPLLMNFKNPTPGVGINNNWALPAKDRYKCDMVLFLAVVHHLVFKQWMTFDQIAATLAEFTKRVVIVEFVHPTDKWVASLMSSIFNWYNLDNFISALSKFFNVKEILPSFPDTRVLLVCENKYPTQ